MENTIPWSKGKKQSRNPSAKGYVISERILWLGLLKHSLIPVERLTLALIICFQDTFISKEKKGSLLSVFFYTKIWESLRKGEGFGEGDLECELFRSRMASHGRGRGVRRNFETGKETKVSFSSQKSFVWIEGLFLIFTEQVGARGKEREEEGRRREMSSRVCFSLPRLAPPKDYQSPAIFRCQTR